PTRPLGRTGRGQDSPHRSSGKPACQEGSLRTGPTKCPGEAGPDRACFPAVFERFTDRARRVVVLAQEEARMLDHNYIGTVHVLLGLIHVGEGVAARSLEALGISLRMVRSEVEEII